MMSLTRPIQLDENTVIFVEVEELSSEEETEFNKLALPMQTATVPLPDDAVETSPVDRVFDTVHQLHDSLRGVLRMVHTSMQEHAPDEWGVELTVGFKGKVNPIPVFVSGEANAAIKVHATWKKPCTGKE